jgi:hypothetical protein
VGTLATLCKSTGSAEAGMDSTSIAAFTDLLIMIMIMIIMMVMMIMIIMMMMVMMMMIMIFN